jgi:7-carboxy-7-deazaguanine synthase
MRGRITEVFDSLQGEGLYLGEKQIFVRFFGCNLSCRFCDTKLDSYFEYEPEELFREIQLYQDDYHSVSFTGGEPLLQPDFLKEILMLSRGAGYKNYLETNGVLYAELRKIIDYVDIVAMDLKLPSSSGMGNLWGFHRRFLETALQKEVFIKAIISASTTEEDLHEAARLISEVKNDLILVLQPNSFDDYESLVSKFKIFKDICDRSNIRSRIIPQVHKLMGIK